MINENIELLKRSVADVCVRAGRTSDVTIVLVTKNVSASLIRKAYDAGIRDFGENKVQEFLAKKDTLPADIRWHFIGHLQTNKVKLLIDKVVLIHSLDSISLADEIEKQAAKRNIYVPVLCEVNTSGEATKCGFAPEEVAPVFETMKAHSHIRVQGLMTMAPFVDDTAMIRSAFRKLRLIRDTVAEQHSQHECRQLSMGMSNDYTIAIEEGATMIRIGTAVFGERQ